MFLKVGHFALGNSETLGVAGHTHIFPHNLAQSLMEMVYGVVWLFFLSYGHKSVQTFANILLSLVKLGGIRRNLAHINLVSQIVLHSIRQHKIAVGQSLHQCRCTQTVGTMVGEVGFTGGKETRDSGL